MRRLTVLLLIATLLSAVVAAPSEAGKKKKKRTAEASYVGSNVGVVSSGLACEAPPFACGVFEVKRGERFVELEIQDDLGQPVYASVYVFGYSDGSDTHDHICGTSDGPLAMTSGLKELVVVIESTGGVLSGCPGPPSAGTIVATFSNRP
jgi:hypothetical protein